MRYEDHDAESLGGCIDHNAVLSMVDKGRWGLSTVNDLEDERGQCLCGKVIRYEYVVENLDTGQLEILGSVHGPWLIEVSQADSFWVPHYRKQELAMRRPLTADERKFIRQSIATRLWADMLLARKDEYVPGWARFRADRPDHHLSNGLWERYTAFGKLKPEQRKALRRLIVKHYAAPAVRARIYADRAARAQRFGIELPPLVIPVRAANEPASVARLPARDSARTSDAPTAEEDS